MLQSIPDRAEYLEIVETLVDEFPEEIEAGAARSVAESGRASCRERV